MSWSAQIRLELGALVLDVGLKGDARPTALVGPNGAGKSTVLRTIAGAHTPQAGRIVVGERVLFEGQGAVLLPPEARKVGYVPQGSGLFEHMSALDNVAFSLRVGGMRAAKARQRATELLEALGCAQLAGRRPRTLSGGERQKVALARALIGEPGLLLLDEPMAALDVTARRQQRFYLLRHLQDRALPMLMVTHELRDVVALGAYTYVIEEGQIVQHGELDALRARPATAFVEAFFAAHG